MFLLSCSHFALVYTKSISPEGPPALEKLWEDVKTNNLRVCYVTQALSKQLNNRSQHHFKVLTL